MGTLCRRNFLKLAGCLPFLGLVRAEAAPVMVEGEVGVWQGIRFSTIKQTKDVKDDISLVQKMLKNAWVSTYYKDHVLYARDNTVMCHGIKSVLPFDTLRVGSLCNDTFKKWHKVNGNLYWHGKHGACFQIVLDRRWHGVIAVIYEGVS